MLVVVVLTQVVAFASSLPPTSPGVGELIWESNNPVSAVLEATTDLSCSFIFLIDGATSHVPVLQIVGERGGVAVLKVMTHNYDNVTHQIFHLVALARKVRQNSWCTMVVVLSDDPIFLGIFGERSLKGRLLVWPTRLLVVTRLAISQIAFLLHSHWTFSMMNTAILKLEDQLRIVSCAVYTYLPYSAAGPRVLQVATWTKARGFLVRDGHSLFQEKYRNFHGATVNVTALPFAPFWDEHEGEGATTTTSYSGTDYMTLAATATALNFTISVVSTSSWAEVASLVVERVSFLSPVIHSVLPQRLERYDFSFVYEFASMDFSMAVPRLKPQWQSLYYPLAVVVWASTLLSLLLAPLLLALVIHVKVRTASYGQISLSAVYQVMTGMLLGQNLPRSLPSSTSTRLLVAAWLVFALILGSAYRGNLTAFLTLPKHPPRPETLPQLVASADRITMPPYGVEYKNFFARSDSPLFKNLAKLIHIVPTTKEGQEQVLLKKQAHLENRRYQQLRIAERFTQADGSALLYIGRERIMPGQSAWPLPHDAPYKLVIDRCLMGVLEGGLYEKWSEDLLTNAQWKSRRNKLQDKAAREMEAEINGSFTALTIAHLQGAFMILLLGLLLTFIVCLTEFLYK